MYNECATSVQRVKIAETYGMTGLEPFMCKVFNDCCYKFKSKNLKTKKGVIYMYVYSNLESPYTPYTPCV